MIQTCFFFVFDSSKQPPFIKRVSDLTTGTYQIHLAHVIDVCLCYTEGSKDKENIIAREGAVQNVNISTPYLVSASNSATLTRDVHSLQNCIRFWIVFPQTCSEAVLPLAPPHHRWGGKTNETQIHERHKPGCFLSTQAQQKKKKKLFFIETFAKAFFFFFYKKRKKESEKVL